MLCADVVVIEAPRLILGEVDDPLSSGREGHIVVDPRVALGAEFNRTLPHNVGINAECDNDLHRTAFGNAQQPEEDMLRAHVSLAESLSLLLGMEDYRASILCEALPHALSIGAELENQTTNLRGRGVVFPRATLPQIQINKSFRPFRTSHPSERVCSMRRALGSDLNQGGTEKE